MEEITKLNELEIVIGNGLQTFIAVGNALMKIRDERLYHQDYNTFEDYCQKRWSIKRSYANKLIAAAEVIDNLGTIVPILPETETQVRPLTRLGPEEQREVWTRAVATAPEGKVTAAHVQRVVDEYHEEAEELSEEEEDAETYNIEDEFEHVETVSVKPHVANNSGNNEWYTPVEYIEAARKVLGKIDLDPASSEEANRVVVADQYYTIDSNGLSHSWKGCIWLNPPYSGNLIGLFIHKLVLHYKQGDVTEAICLVNNATETIWFNEIVGWASAIVFPASRVKFWKPDGETGAPLQGQAIIYIGSIPEKFMAVFQDFGWGAWISKNN